MSVRGHTPHLALATWRTYVVCPMSIRFYFSDPSKYRYKCSVCVGSSGYRWPPVSAIDYVGFSISRGEIRDTLSSALYIMCGARYFYLCLFCEAHIWIRVTCKGEFELATDGQIFLCIFILGELFFLFFPFSSLISSALTVFFGAFCCFSASKIDELVVLLWMLGCWRCRCAAAPAEYWMLLLFMYTQTHIFMLCSSCAQYFLLLFSAWLLLVAVVVVDFCESISLSLSGRCRVYSPRRTPENAEQYYWFL